MGYWPCDDDDDDDNDDDPREKSNQRAEGSEGLEKVKLVQVFSNKNRFEQVERENLQRGFHLVSINAFKAMFEKGKFQESALANSSSFHFTRLTAHLIPHLKDWMYLIKPPSPISRLKPSALGFKPPQTQPLESDSPFDDHC
ncbi:hypothetical protein RUM44_003711 [Polyplax serrata]|uniref:Uncharacterized protein n=1 Tax=Polyplax serrata TaxID=468196 RepID=A0ABR1AIQ4_POLSC